MMRRKTMNKGRLFIISGPSGSGKDTVLGEVLKTYPDLKFSISSITRPMREGEKEGEKYHFISREEFEDMIKNDRLLEHNVFVGNYYGTPREPVEKCIEAGEDIFVEIDVNGAAQIREKAKDALSIFIMPPSMSVLRARLTGRGTETPELIEKRLEAAAKEIARADEYDYIVINDVLEDAVADVNAIIRSDRAREERNEGIAQRVLNS
ncbi:MAG: guanylate kinase [Clostridia bacterium]|nr:guanylate kinase [Clostridia bacterium]